jgi:hypothetical protein
MTVVVELSAVATVALRAVQDAILHEPHRAPAPAAGISPPR